jgi:hypothetical protein
MDHEFSFSKGAFHSVARYPPYSTPRALADPSHFGPVAPHFGKISLPRESAGRKQISFRLAQLRLGRLLPQEPILGTPFF